MRAISQSNLLFNIAFFLVIVYQQYVLYKLHEQNIEQQNQINKIISHDVKFQDDPMITAKVVPPVNVIHNSFLDLKSPKTIEGMKLGSTDEVKRDFYGGKGDATHLGGFTARDNSTISENLWNFMLSQLAVKSVLDIGCGKGFSASYFLSKGARVLCVEGSRDAIKHSLLPSDRVVEHDFSRGAWWPEDTFDVAWSTEFLEHVGRQYMKNYMPAFSKSALVMVSASGWGGWHHVEVHDQKWWIGRFQARGFIYSPEITEWVRFQAFPDGYSGNALILKHGLLVFINPSVASLQKHSHLFGGNGCYKGAIDNRDGGQECTGPDELPPAFKSLMTCSKPSDFKSDEEYSQTYWKCNK